MTQHTTTADRVPRRRSAIVSQVAEHTSRLVRDQLRLAQAEMAAKGKKAGIGAGLFGGAGSAALVGRREVSQAAPPLPNEALAGVKQDVQALKPGTNL